MPICHNRKVIFLHIPRCGGTSLEVSLGLISPAKTNPRKIRPSSLYGTKQKPGGVLVLQHLTGQALRQAGLIDDKTWNAYFKFTVIRDPFARMASDYCWQKRHDPHHEFRHLSFQEFLDRAEQVMQEARYFEKIHYEHFRPMVEYCFFEQQLVVDDILLLESLPGELKRIESVTGPLILTKLNSSRNYSELDTQINRDRVYRLYEADKSLHDQVSRLQKTGP